MNAYFSMDTYLGLVKNKQVFYFGKEECCQLKNLLPERNWILLAIADEAPDTLLDKVAKDCLDKGVLYICGAGKLAGTITEIFDLELSNRKIETGDENYEDVPMTACYPDMEKGFWFSATRAYYDSCTLDSLVCINLTDEDYQDRIAALISKINNGSLPEQ